MEFCIVQCSCPLAQAERLAQGLLNERLAACVQILAMQSVYRWQGKIESEREGLLQIKTRWDRFEAVKTWLLANHPYEVPEILGLPITTGHGDYLAWINACLAPDEPDSNDFTD